MPEFDQRRAPAFRAHLHADVIAREHDGKCRACAILVDVDDDQSVARGERGSIFLSYAGTDVEAAARVAAGLRAAGARVWWDEDGIGWGDNWLDKLQDTLETCAGYLILVGRSGVRRWVKAELHVALKRHFEEELPIFALRLSGVSPQDLPPFLRIFQSPELPETIEDFDYATLAETLQAAAAATPAGDLFGPDICPFPGLEAFREQDTAFFFGRQSETLDALRHLGRGLDGGADPSSWTPAAPAAMAPPGTSVTIPQASGAAVGGVELGGQTQHPLVSPTIGNWAPAASHGARVGN